MLDGIAYELDESGNPSNIPVNDDEISDKDRQVNGLKPKNQET